MRFVVTFNLSLILFWGFEKVFKDIKMENTKTGTRITIKVSYSFKSIVRSFQLPEDSCLYKYFVENNHIITRDNKLLRTGIPELDEQVKELAQNNIEMQSDFMHDGHPMDILVWRNDKPVYFIKDYFSENEIQEIITKML